MKGLAHVQAAVLLAWLFFGSVHEQVAASGPDELLSVPQAVQALLLRNIPEGQTQVPVPPL